MDIENLLVGAQQLAIGGNPKNIRFDRSAALIVADAHGRFQEANLVGNLYSGGMTTTAITNAIWTTGTTDATAKPIAGVYNPVGSGYNLVILQVKVNTIITAATTTGYGTLMYCTSLNNAAISTGNAPFNRATLQASGSVAKDMSGIALTGLTTALTVRDTSGLGSSNGNYSQVGTAVGFALGNNATMVDNVDGAYIIPPGGFFGVFATTTPVAVSAASSILWEEVLI